MRPHLWIPAAALLLLACDKPSSTSGIAPPKDSAPSSAPPPTVSAAQAQPTPSSVPVVGTGSVAATASGAPSTPTTAATIATAKGKDAGAAAATLALKPASTHMSGKNFVLDVASPGCK